MLQPRYYQRHSWFSLEYPACKDIKRKRKMDVTRNKIWNAIDHIYTYRMRNGKNKLGMEYHLTPNLLIIFIALLGIGRYFLKSSKSENHCIAVLQTKLKNAKQTLSY